MSTALSPQMRDALEAWLTQLAKLHDASPHTHAAYQRDVAAFLHFLALHHGEGAPGLAALGALTQADLRAWMAHERARGVAPRSLARSLSAVKNFAAWVEERCGVDVTTILSARAPRFQSKLPRPLEVDAAQEMLSTTRDQARKAWIGARDGAVLALLYGCGLRISEALGLPCAAHPLGEALRITGKGRKTRLVPVLPIVRAAVAEYVRLCPFDLAGEPQSALFRGQRGKAVNPRVIARAVEQARMQMGLPASATPHAMRHSFASHLLAAGGDLRTIQELLGHASLSATQAYTAIDTAQLLQTYEKAHPRA